MQAESIVATRSNTPATDAVLATTELFEQILSHFDIKELVLLRRVSRHWSDVMQESLVLQRIMFLAPEPKLPFEWHLNIGAYEEPYIYTKERFGTWMELEVFGYESSRFNPLLFEARPDPDTGNLDVMYHFFHSLRLYPRHLLKDVRTSKLFSRMLIAQPPITYALVGCNTALCNTNGIRVRDLVHAMEVENDHVCEFGHVLSFVVPHVMFPTREEEKKGQMIRQCTESENH